MWGYIDVSLLWVAGTSVPSLYVRVYQYIFSRSGCIEGSLIICEGISRKWEPGNGEPRFPHYMWGYIAITYILNPECLVPSLYVRVYHILRCSAVCSICSLIICEGISPFIDAAGRKALFPHYMWGYIDKALKLNGQYIVPSLYVRVYRSWTERQSSDLCSLIICEGISSLNVNYNVLWLFPHYIWGYIEIGNGILQASKNINVVHDSIPQIA